MNALGLSFLSFVLGATLAQEEATTSTPLPPFNAHVRNTCECRLPCELTQPTPRRNLGSDGVIPPIPSPRSDRLEITQCAPVELGWQDLVKDSPTKGPYFLVLYSPRFQPAVVPLGNKNAYSWTANLPIGQPYILGMRNGDGLRGGNCDIVYPSRGPDDCALLDFLPNALEFTVDGLSECGNMIVNVTDGTGPYAMTVIPTSSTYREKTVTFVSEIMEYPLDFSPGVSFLVHVNDTSTGKQGISDVLTVTPGNDPWCRSKASTLESGFATETFSFPFFITGSTTLPTQDHSSPSPLPSRVNVTAIAAGCAALICVLIGVSFLVFFCLRRRARKRSAERHEILGAWTTGGALDTSETSPRTVSYLAAVPYPAKQPSPMDPSRDGTQSPPPPPFEEAVADTPIRPNENPESLENEEAHLACSEPERRDTHS
ncbi:hypothetical protein EXIGLDRAFT_696774 [Exidia glandulosa HHB12029]|uniref:Mid2 domain-containing protein n=1 Tax=Exidia glandulosa HHB12029 TaxID=1314781 RepID=A0A165F4R9_EXIGL|nr:hypothetical protein EXIGLDRAFT_696774 [Exidia glandulosa HHB12029]